jgi:hypothetical protein
MQRFLRSEEGKYLLPDDFICFPLVWKTEALASSTSFASRKETWVAGGLALLDALAVSI